VDTPQKIISVVTPCYNEELNVDEAYETVRRVFEEHLPQYRREHIFCDNASTDATPQMLRELAARDPDVKVILNSRNFGPTRSTYNGIVSASGDAVLMFMPADLQDPPDLLPEFVGLWEQGYEIVYGIRATRSEGLVMRSIRRAYYRLIAAVSNIKVPPDVGDFQLIDKKVLAAMRQTHDAFPYIRMMTFEAGFRSVGVKYHWQARKRGMSKNRFFNLVDEGLNGLITFTSVPLRLCLYAGTIISILAMLYAVVTVIYALTHGGMAQPGIATLIVALFFFSGVQLFFLGLLGEYIIAIYGQVRSKPMVIERERLNFTPPAAS
jgi:glycosyltransferase involved in cell wall biosynthesis